jgi:hypothetical protein
MEQRGEWVEQRKDLWREDAKLDSTRTHAADELRSAERNLASMVDKVNTGVLSESATDLVSGYWYWVTCRRFYCRTFKSGWRLRSSVSTLRGHRCEIQYCCRVDSRQ